MGFRVWDFKNHVQKIKIGQIQSKFINFQKFENTVFKISKNQNFVKNQKCNNLFFVLDVIHMG